MRERDRVMSTYKSTKTVEALYQYIQLRNLGLVKSAKKDYIKAITNESNVKNLENTFIVKY